VAVEELVLDSHQEQDKQAGQELWLSATQVFTRQQQQQEIQPYLTQTDT
jgi:hypothetical protein